MVRRGGSEDCAASRHQIPKLIRLFALGGVLLPTVLISQVEPVSGRAVGVVGLVFLGLIWNKTRTAPRRTPTDAAS